MSTKKRISKAEIMEDLGLTDENANSNDLWNAFTRVCNVVAEELIINNEYWEEDERPPNSVLTWYMVPTSVKNRIFSQVKRKLASEEFSDGRAFNITYKAFNWMFGTKVDYQLRQFKPKKDSSTSNVSQYWDPVLDANEAGGSSGA